MAKKAASKKSKVRFSVINELHENIMKNVEVTRKGEPRLKRTAVKAALEQVFADAAKKAAGGERVRFPVIGTMARREVKARKGGKGTNPFTGEPMTVKARPATKKPRWSFPKTIKETFSNKRYW